MMVAYDFPTTVLVRSERLCPLSALIRILAPRRPGGATATQGRPPRGCAAGEATRDLWRKSCARLGWRRAQWHACKQLDFENHADKWKHSCPPTPVR